MTLNVRNWHFLIAWIRGDVDLTKMSFIFIFFTQFKLPFDVEVHEKFLNVICWTSSQRIWTQNSQLSPFYSAPLIFAVLRNLVREIWFKKSGSRNLVQEKWLTRKKVVLYHKSTRNLVPKKWLTRKKNLSLQNHFSTHLSKL